ncbi:uncharacterized protein LOC121243296 [Juglans microcarpa x Juglans regia]|uniref:uncharacterized protein LOC121243296 n=1 Tax=Juglans microcarpa x Juglans regia TaxID=2249226 RepID=UPI001B7E1EF8|nr:uncharacterized protein LOC121243296 [Juglans microcarpa x Juglans regia]
MTVDESFKKPGAVPFKWEIKPGVPKLQHQQKQPVVLSPPPLPQPRNYHRTVLRTPQQKLRPPPSSGSVYFVPPLESPSRVRSFRSSPRTRSERWRFDRQTTALVRPEVVSPGCFLSSFLKRSKPGKQRLQKPGPASEPDYSSDLETLARWSVSSRKSLSPFSESPSTSSFSSSYPSSPRPVGDAEWAGFGLF